MKKEKTLITIAAILLIIHGFCITGIGGFSIVDSYYYTVDIWQILLTLYGVIALSMGIISIVISRKEESLIQKKTFILVFAIMSVFNSMISAVLLFVAYVEIGSYLKSNPNLPNAPNNTVNMNNKKKEEVVKEYVSPEKRKIDTLAKLGVLLVVLSGIILSTSYNNIFSSDISKPIIMLVLFGIFRGLYRLFDTKIKIESSSKLYYILSYVFFVLIFISISYFGIIDYDFSFDGYYSDLMYSIVSLSLAFSVISIRNKYNYKILGELSFSFVILSFVLILNQFNFETIQMIGILLVISLFLYMNKEKLEKCIININDLMFALLGLLFLINYLFTEELDLFKVILGIFYIVLLRQRIVTNDRYACATRYILPIFTNILIVSTISQASNSCSINETSSIFITAHVFNYRLITIVVLLLSSYLFLRAKDKETIHSGLISSIALSFYETLYLINYEYSMIGVLASIFIFCYITIILKIAEKDTIKKTCFISQFISLLLLSISGVLFYKNNGIDMSLDTIISVYLVFIMIICRFEKALFEEYKLIRVVYFGTVITLLITCSIFISNHNIVYNLIMLAILFVYRSYANIYENKKHVFNYLLLLCAFLNLSIIIIAHTSVLITNAILLITLLITAYYVSRQRYTSYFILCLAYIPFILALKELTLSNELFIILSRLPLMVIVFVITRKLLKMKLKTTNIIETILLSIVFISYIYEVGLTLGLFTFIIALIMIYIGFRNEKYNSLFVVGIIATILNIIFQLQDFWRSVPLPVYLLLSGLAIIGYVTYKEISKNKQEIKEEKKELLEENIDTSNNLINIILLLITCSSIIINNYNISSEIKIKEIREVEVRLTNKGIDLNKIYFNENKETIYILEGTHYDVGSIIKEYSPSDYKSDYMYYTVRYVTEEQLDKVRNNKRLSYYDFNDNYYDEGTNKYFSYNGPVNRNFSINGVNIKVENSIINYLDGSYEDYGYYRSNITSRYLVYNVNDINKLELYISNTDGKDVKIITSNETYNVENDGYYSFVSKNGKVTIEVTDKMSSDTKDKSYYYQN